MSTKKSPKIAICQNPECGLEFKVGPGTKGLYCSLSCSTKQAAKERKPTIEQQRQEREQEYLKNPKLCLHCESIIPYNKQRANKYCSSSCSASATNIGKVQSEETKRKISDKLTKIVRDPITQNHIPRKDKDGNLVKIYKTKTNNCKACGNLIFVSENCECGLNNKFRQFKGLNKYFSLSLDKLGTSDFINDYKNCIEYMKQLYCDNPLPMIAEIVNHPDKSGGNIGKIYKSCNIPLRSISEAQRLALLSGRYSLPQHSNNRFKHGYYKSWYYRSSYELNYIKLLEANDIKFDMECLRIPYFDTQKRVERVAIPDFLINKNVIVEMKGSYTYDKQNMVDKFIAYSSASYQPYLILDNTIYYFQNGQLSELSTGYDPMSPEYKTGILPIKLREHMHGRR